VEALPAPFTASTVDTIAPVFSQVSVSPAAFHVAPRASALVARRVPAGTTIRYRLSEAATVRLAVERTLAGRRRGRACSRPTRALRRAKPCLRFSRVGVLRRAGGAGANSVPFSGRIGRRALTPGHYRLTVEGKDAAGNSAHAKQLSFRILAPTPFGG
jgi:hypothetical protein